MASEYGFRNSGSGSQYSNTYGTQNNNSGSGNQFNANTINYNAQNQNDSKLLADLRVTNPCDDKARIERTRGRLLRDSYKWILDHEAFVQWQTDTQSSLLWIRGDPGKGKTMLICGIIDELPARMPGWDTIYFFCEATDSRVNNATAVLRSLLYLLLRKRPSLSRFILEEHEHAGKRLFEDTNAWDVLYRTFTNIVQDGGLNDFILIIDALDECKTGLYQLLDFIVRLSLLNVKVITSSRNWPSIEEAVAEVSDQVCIKLELNEASISSAVKEYISYKVNQLALRKKYNINTQNYVYSCLSSKANGTFLWVALVTEQLGKPGVSERHAVKTLEEFPRELNALYERMLEQTWESNDRDICRRILAVVSIVYRPITLLELMSLAGLEEFRTKTEILETIVGECGSLLTVKDGVVYFVHQSAKDFLSGHALAEVMPSGIRHEHKLLLSRSLEVMSKTCRRNIYDLKEPASYLDDIPTPVSDPLGPAKYACVYWLEHVNDGGRVDEQQYSQVYNFLKDHFLHWLEALSLLRSMSGGIAGLFRLARAVQASEMSEPRLFLQDALRFIRYFRVAVENWPLQLYSSALIFSPTQSIIRKQFQKEVAKWIIKQPVVEDQWSQLLQTLDGHRGSITSLAVAPLGSTLASASFDRTVKLWNTITGECLRTLSHEDRVASVAFSLKGDKLVSASEDGIVKLWVQATGQLLKTFNGTPSSCSQLCVAFCNGDQQVTLGSQTIVDIWDTASGQRVRQFISQRRAFLPGVAFSADGALFASNGTKGQAVLFDTGTGTCSKTLVGNGGNSFGSYVAFSDDKTRLVTCGNKFLILWDTLTSESIWTDEAEYTDGDAAAFSRHGGLIACSSVATRTLKIRDAVTGEVLQILPVTCAMGLAFSLDDTQLFSGSSSDTISVWDLTRLQRRQLNKTGMLVSRLTSTAKSLDSYDTANGACTTVVEDLEAINGSHKFILAVAFSHDGKQLASLSRSRFAIWDFTTGQCLKTNNVNLVDRRVRTSSLVHSKNGILFAGVFAVGSGNTIAISDAATGLHLRSLDHEKTVVSICFSKDGTTLASSSWDGTTKLWNSATGTGLQLITATSIINLGSLSSAGLEMSTAQAIQTTSSNPQDLMLSGNYEGEWIQKDFKSILWIPPEYRVSAEYFEIYGDYVYDARGSAIALGCDSGLVLMMEFSSDLSVM